MNENTEIPVVEVDPETGLPVNREGEASPTEAKSEVDSSESTPA